MTLEQNKENLPLYEEVDQELDALSPNEAESLPLPTTYKKTEEEQESIEEEQNPDNQFKKFADECALKNANVRNDKKLP
ncbi:hypothetical protein J5751_03575 [bacterium]|nr:hypothetical protein [bacterium]